MAKPGAGIYVLGSRSRIEGNHLSQNDYGIYTDGVLNLIVRNSAGVALAAIQELARRLESVEAENARLKREVADQIAPMGDPPVYARRVGRHERLMRLRRYTKKKGR